MQDPITRHSFVHINNSYVHLVQYGLENSSMSNNVSLTSNSTLTATSNSLSASRNSDKSISLNKSQSSELQQTRKLIIFVPGNPGCLGIYHDFLVVLFRTLSSGTELSDHPTILAIGHNNFDHPDDSEYKAHERISLEENEMNFVERALAKKHVNDPNHIELQVLNKLVILKRLIKIETCQVIFVGHSIGGYVILKLLQDRLVSAAHLGTVLIHPALENLALTTKGSSLNRLFHYKLDLLVELAAYLLQYLPHQAKMALARWYCPAKFLKSSSQIAIDSVTQLIKRRALSALIQMARSELAVVKNINADSMIKPHVPKLKLIYAIKDHWVNTNNRRMLTQLYPKLHVEEHDRMHAFVMDPQTVDDYALKVGLFVRDFFDKQH